MLKIIKPILTFVIALLLSGSLFANVLADNPIIPTADTYTDGSDPDSTWDLNFSADKVMQLSASNLAGCVPTTYLWYKFAVPAGVEPIESAELSLDFGTLGEVGYAPLELMASSDTSWDESVITWSSQPQLDAGLLSTAASVSGGGTAEFSDANFANYLDDHKGETVTLVVRANCTANPQPSPSANRTIASKESRNGSGALLRVNSPTTVSRKAFLPLLSSNYNSSGLSGTPSIWHWMVYPTHITESNAR